MNPAGVWEEGLRPRLPLMEATAVQTHALLWVSGCFSDWSGCCLCDLVPNRPPPRGPWGQRTIRQVLGRSGPGLAGPTPPCSPHRRSSLQPKGRAGMWTGLCSPLRKLLFSDTPAKPLASGQDTPKTHPFPSCCRTPVRRLTGGPFSDLPESPAGQAPLLLKPSLPPVSSLPSCLPEKAVVSLPSLTPPLSTQLVFRVQTLMRLHFARGLAEL